MRQFSNYSVKPLPLVGEMGQRILEFNWDETTMGAINTWPSAMVNNLSTITAVPFPMALFWGADYITFYNDAFIATLGTEGKHPGILGKPHRESFAEAQNFVKPLFDCVFYKGGSCCFEDKLVPIFRNGRLDDVYWTFTCSPVYDDNGKIAGVLVVCSETTEKVKTIMHMERQLHTLAKHSPDIITQIDSNRKVLYASHAIEKLTGTSSQQFIGKSYSDLNLPADICDIFDAQLDIVFANKQPNAVEHYTQDTSSYLSTRLIPELDENNNVQSVISISTDITARKKAEDELRYQKNLLESITSNTDAAIFLMDEKQYCIYMNEAANKMTGFSLNEVKDHPLHYYIHHSYPDGTCYPLEECPIDNVLFTAKQERGEEIFVHKNGSFYPVAFTASPIYSDARAVGTVIEVRETTEEKKKERELLLAINQQQEAFSLLESLLKNAPVGFAFFDRQHRYVSVNEQLAYINGFPVEAHIGKSIAELLPHNANAVIPILQKVAATGESLADIEVMGYTPRVPGVERVWLAGFYPVFDETVKQVKYVGATVIEITERKRAEQALLLEQNFTKSLLDASPALTYIFDIANGCNTFISNQVTDILGYSISEVTDMGSQVLEFLLHPDDLKNAHKRFDKLIAEPEDRIIELEYRMRHKNGDWVWLFDRARVFRRSNGVPTEVLGVANDVTTSKKREAQLRESEEQMRVFINHAPAAVAMLDRELHYLGVSQKWIQDFNLSAEIIGLSHYSVFPDIPEKWKHVYQQALLGKVEKANIDRFIREDGSTTWLKWEARPWKGGDGNIGGIVIFSEDITERIQAEEELKQSNERLKAAIDASLTGTFRWNIRTNELSWDENLDKLFGLKAKETVQSFGSFIERVHPDDRKVVIAACELCAEKGADFKQEFRVVYPDGTIRWLDDKGKTYADESGKPLYMTGACVDITEHKLASEKIRLSEQRFEAAVQAVQGILWTNNALGQMEGEQPAWASLTGQQYQDYQGYGWSAAIHPDDIQPTVAAWNEAVGNRTSFYFEHRVKRKDNVWRRYSIRAIPLLNDEGAVVEWVGVHTDVTDQRLAEAALRESEAQLRDFSNNIQSLAWMADSEGNVYWYNQRWYNYTGASFQEMLGCGWEKVYHPEYMERVTTFFQEGWSKGKPFEMIFPMRRFDGVYR